MKKKKMAYFPPKLHKNNSVAGLCVDGSAASYDSPVTVSYDCYVGGDVNSLPDYYHVCKSGSGNAAGDAGYNFYYGCESGSQIVAGTTGGIIYVTGSCDTGSGAS